MTKSSFSADRRKLLQGAMALPFVAVMPALGGAAFAQDASKPLRFLIVASLTGPGTSFGTGMSAAAQTAIDQINAKGGGQKIEAVVVDTGTDPSKAAVLFQDEISKQRPAAAFHAGSTAEVLALAPLATREQIPLFTISDLPALTDVGKFKYVFGTQSTFETVAVILAKKLKEAGVNKLALLTALDGTGEIMTSFMPPALKAEGIELLANERYKPTDVDMSSQLRKLDSLNPDAIYVEGSGAPTGYILQGLIRLGVTRPVICGKAMAASNLESLVDATKLGPTYVFNHAISHRGPGGRGESGLVKTAMPAFLSKSGGKLTTALYIYAWGYDAPYIWSKAVSDAKTADPAKVVAELESWAKKPPTGVQFMTRDDYPFTPEMHLPPAAASGYNFARVGTLDAAGTRESVAFKVK